MKIQIIDQIDDLSAVETEWSRLLAKTPNASFFQTLGWLKAYWKHFADDQILKVLVVSEADSVTGILPLVVRKERTKVGTVAFLTYPLDFWGSFYGPIGADPSEVLARGIDYLSHRKRRDWDTLELRWVGTSKTDSDDTEQALSVTGLSPVRSTIDTTAVVDLSGNWSDYLAARGSKWRNNLKRWERRMNEVGTLRYVRVRSEKPGSDPHWNVFEDCIAVAQRSWQADSSDGTTVCHDKIKPFITDSHRAAAESGSIDMNLFYLDDQPVGFAYNYQLHGNVFGLRIGHIPELKSKGVGNLLYARALEDSFDRGDWRYDLGPGSIEIKRHLYTHVLPIYRLSCFRKLSLRQQLLRWRRVQDNRSSLRDESKQPA